MLVDAYAAAVAALVAVTSEPVRQTLVLEEQVRTGFGRHPDVEIYLSQPGLEMILGARVLAEFGDDPDRYADTRAREELLRYGSGYPGLRHETSHTGPASPQPGVADALYQQAFAALTASAGARAFYDRQRARGVTHRQALRALANRLVGILHGCLTHQCQYDENVARVRGQQGWLWVLPAVSVYAAFVIYPLTQTLWYSFYDWDGIGVARWVGLANYGKVLSDQRLRDSVLHSLVLIFFFTVLPIVFGLVTAALVADLRGRRAQMVLWVVLFLPQVIPLVGAALAWVWLYSSDGAVNQLLKAVGLGALARPWLADFATALPAVGLIGTWFATGLCTVLFTAGIQRVDPALLEAAALDGAGRVRRMVSVILPGLRREIVVAATVLTIAALASFDII